MVAVKVGSVESGTGYSVEHEIANPYPVGSIKYKEFEKDVRWLQRHEKLVDRDEYGNFIVYKTSGFQRAVIVLLILILIVLLAK